MIDWQLEIPGVKLESANQSLRGVTREAMYGKAAKAKDQRCGVTTMCWAKFGAPPPAPLTITITRVAPAELDSDNCTSAAKHCRDGVSDWLGINDRDKRLLWICNQEKQGKGVYAVKVRVQTRVLTLDEMLALDAPYQKARKKADAIWNKLTIQERSAQVCGNASSNKWDKAHAAQAVRYVEVTREWEAQNGIV